MNESEARRALLVRRFETASPPTAVWREDDREWATRAAAGTLGEGASHDAFVATRAALAAERLGKRDTGVAHALAATRWRPWVGWALLLVSFVLGAATDAIGTGKLINVLAPPLLALMAWNLFVYLLLAVRTARPRLAGGRIERARGPLARLLARVGHLALASGRDRPPGGDTARSAEARAHAAQAAGGSPAATADTRSAPSPVGPVLAGFAADWARASTSLNTHRLSRVLHLAAIGFALGALAGLYYRGLAFEYRAGWESTFLDAQAVSTLLHWVLGPASAITGVGLPDAARLEAMRFPASAGEPAASWIHLYAVTVALVVLMPRALLALFDYVHERRLAADFPVRLEDGYFAALGHAQRGEPAPMAVLPYNHTPGPQAKHALERLLAPVIGAGLALEMLPAVGYGDEDEAGEPLARHGPLTGAVALLNATATPESETHGRFVESVAAALPAGTPLAVVVDESAFVARFGSDETGRRRREERRQAWTRLLADNERKPVFVTLDGQQPASANEPALREALAGAVRARRVH